MKQYDFKNIKICSEKKKPLLNQPFICRLLHEITFRVRTKKAPSAGTPYLIQIAKPAEKLDEELTDLILGLIVGLTASTLLLVILSYLTAGFNAIFTHLSLARSAIAAYNFNR